MYNYYLFSLNYNFCKLDIVFRHNYLKKWFEFDWKNLKCFFLGSDPCTQGHDCQHICFSSGDSYACKCRTGYVLNADKKTCSRKSILDCFNQCLLWFLHQTINYFEYMLNVDNKTFHILFFKIRKCFFDFECRNNQKLLLLLVIPGIFMTK